MNCPLCQHLSEQLLPKLLPNDHHVFECTHCHLIFKNPADYISHQEDFNRYQHHQNDFDTGYVKFLNRLLEPLTPFLTSEMSALDFGCGPGPTLSKLLKEKVQTVAIYDPHFFPDQSALLNRYDVVTCTEVVEHFKNAKTDWEQLIKTVKPLGLVAIMTQFYLDNERTHYQSWWYKNDPTHVVFYQQRTLEYLALKYHLEIVYNDKTSVVIFKKRAL